MIVAGSANGSAARQDPTDGRLRAAAPLRGSWSFWRLGDLEEPADGVAGDSEGDHTGGGVDVGDRVRRHQAAVAGEAARADRQRIGDVRDRAVHRTLDPADDPPVIVGDEEAGGRTEVGGDCAHRLNVFPVCKEIPFTG